MVTLVCKSPKAFARIGEEVFPENLALEPAKIALETAQSIAHETGAGPNGLAVVMQRLHRLFDDGKIKFKVLEEVNDFFDTALDAGIPDEDSVVREIVPILRRRIEAQVVREASAGYANQGDFGQTQKLIDKALRLGEKRTLAGIKLQGSAIIAEIRRLKELERLPVGVPELDFELEGGLQRGGLGIVVGASGDGKSMFLSHAGACALKKGLFVVQATLELPPPLILARITAALIGIPTNALIAEPEIVSEPLARMTKRGPYYIAEFPAQVATFQDVEDFVKQCEEQEGRKIDLLITDYGDKLTHPGAKDSEGAYTLSRKVFERMRLYAADRKIFHWTASQATRSKDKKRILDLNDVADSLHKARIADLVVTINLSEDQGEVKFNIAKHRTAQGRKIVGPLPTDYACGRVAPILEEST